MSAPWLGALAGTSALLLGACGTTSTNVTGTAGTTTGGAPAATAVPSAGTVTGAPACRGFPPAGETGLPCLGPGKPVGIDTLPGPTVVSVWASWCAPCREELPVLQQFAATGGSVLGVDVGDEPEAAAALLADLGVTFPSVQDPGSTTRGTLGWVGPPANYVVVDGRVVHRFAAAITSVDQVRQAVAGVT